MRLPRLRTTLIHDLCVTLDPPSRRAMVRSRRRVARYHHPRPNGRAGRAPAFGGQRPRKRRPMCGLARRLRDFEKHALTHGSWGRTRSSLAAGEREAGNGAVAPWGPGADIRRGGPPTCAHPPSPASRFLPAQGPSRQDAVQRVAPGTEGAWPREEGKRWESPMPGGRRVGLCEWARPVPVPRPPSAARPKLGACTKPDESPTLVRSPRTRLTRRRSRNRQAPGA